MALNQVPTPARFLRPTLRAVAAMALREVGTSYGRATGGFLWVLAEPVLGIGLLSVLFSLILHTPPLGRSFAVFYATGILPYLLYMDLARKTGAAVAYSRPLLFYPAVTIVDALLARFLLNLGAGLCVFVLVIAALHLLAAPRTAIDPAGVALALAMAAALGFGVGAVNCYLWARVPTWERVWGILNKPLFLLSGILFLAGDVPEPYRGWLEWNPVLHVTAAMRAGFYPAYQPDFVSPGYVFGLAGICAVLGLSLLLRDGRRLLE